MQKQFRCKHQVLFVVIFLVFGMVLGGCDSKKQKVYHVGILSGAEPFANIAEGFKIKMTELGYIEKKNIIYYFEKTNSNSEAERRILKKFVQDKVDLILTFPTEPAMEAKAITAGTNIPIVFAMAGTDGNSLVKSVRHPGGNITGVRYPNAEMSAKWLEFLHELAPQVKRVYLVYDRNYPNAPYALESMGQTAASLGMTLVKDPVTNNQKELEAALAKRSALADIEVDAISVMPDMLNHSPDGFEAIRKFAAEHRLPIAGGMDFMADWGAMFSYVPFNIDQGMLAATLADKIFKGTPAGTLPVITPEGRLRLNYKAIQKLGLTIPESLMARAREIIR
jgi:putative ABC transport system substrate-binding protein